MKLFIFNEISRAAAYGIGTYIKELLYGLEDCDINVNLVVLYAEINEFEIRRNEGVTEWLIPGNKYHYYKNYTEGVCLYYKEVVRLIRIHVPEHTKILVHLNYLHCLPLIRNLRNYFDCKIVTVVHYMNWCFDLQGNHHWMRTILAKPEDKLSEIERNALASFKKDREIFMESDGIVCLAEHTRNFLLSDYAIEPDKIHLIYNGLRDISLLVKTGAGKKELKKHFFIEGEQIILFAGRIDEIKGTDILIEAFSIVLKSREDCRLLIAGDGDVLKHLKFADNIWSKVTFTGRLEKEKLYGLYQISDIGVMPSRHEPFGYVALEMMMHELPVIATSSSGLNEIVEDETTGLKIDINEGADNVEISATVLAEKIIYLLDNPEMAVKFGKQGRNRYLEYFTTKVMINQLINLYNKMYDYTIR